MIHSCPNSACALLFSSLNDVAIHLGDPGAPCGAIQRTHKMDEMDLAKDSDDEDAAGCEGNGVLRRYPNLPLKYPITRCPQRPG